VSKLPRLPASAPDGLLEELASRGATPTEGWREHARFYARAQSPEGAFFVRWSLDGDDVAVLQHEAAVRRLVGSDGPLRSPPVLAEGRGWLVERAILPEPWANDAVAGVAAAAGRLAELELPPAPQRSGRELGLRRRLALARRPRLVRELLRAERLVSQTGLPTITGHGDFHAGNILVASGPWIVDWELSRPLPAGYDLMQFWATAPDEVDRELVFDAAVEIVGRSRRMELARLRYAVLVRMIATKLTAGRSFDRDPTGACELLHLLPSAKSEADL
jgi:hypothetical protein